MKNTAAAVCLLSLFCGGCASNGADLGGLLSSAESVLADTGSGPLSTDEIAMGLKEALTRGSGLVVNQLGQKDGFNADPLVRIRLPESLQKARSFAAKIGMEGSFDDLETRLNRAAEQATPKAKELFLGAIQSMSISDARSILQGPDNAATEYFRSRTGDQLEAQMRPIVDRALAEVGAVRTFNDMLARYNQIPLAPRLDADLTGHVVEQGSDGIFQYLAKEEKAIRENPLKRTSKLLQRVFASR